MHKGNGEKQTLTMHFFSRLVCWKSQALGIAYLDFAPLFTAIHPPPMQHIFQLPCNPSLMQLCVKIVEI